MHFLPKRKKQERKLVGNSEPSRNSAADSHFEGRSDEEIWLDFKQGSDSALSYVYRHYANPLFNYGCQLINCDELVQDSVQDLFMDIIRNRRNLGDVHSIKFYLFTSLRRKIFKKLKKERNQHIEEINTQSEVKFGITSSPEFRMIKEQLTEEQHRLINMACQQLTERQREAILLYFYEEFSYKQIAEIMNVGKVKSARVMIYRAIEKLQSVLVKVRDQLLLFILFSSELF